MSHDNHNDHHHVDDLSGFSLTRVIWPAALLIVLIFVTRNYMGGDECCSKGECCEKPGAKKEMHKDHGAKKEEAPAHH
jgi:hypothetical protein